MKTPHFSFLSLAFAIPALAAVACGGGSSSATPGTGGSTGGGGSSGGSSGTVDCTMDTGTSMDTISDFEDGSGTVLPNQMRNGGWYAYNDASPTCVESPMGMSSAGAEAVTPARCMSTYALHVKGMGCSLWGAGVGTDFAAPPPPDGGAVDAGGATAAKTPYDVSMFAGVQFWGKIEAGSTASVRVKVPMTDDTKIVDGGNCMLTETGTDKCSDDWGSKVALTTSWKLYKLPFASMMQEGWGKKFDFNKAHVTSVQFQVAAKTTFDFWIDDVSFFK
jgi:hypothetical protein